MRSVGVFFVFCLVFVTFLAVLGGMSFSGCSHTWLRSPPHLLLINPLQYIRSSHTSSQRRIVVKYCVCYRFFQRFLSLLLLVACLPQPAGAVLLPSACVCNKPCLINCLNSTFCPICFWVLLRTLTDMIRFNPKWSQLCDLIRFHPHVMLFSLICSKRFFCNMM